MSHTLTIHICTHTYTQTRSQTYTHTLSRQDDLTIFAQFLSCTHDHEMSVEVLKLALTISHSYPQITSSWCKEWPSILLQHIHCGSSESRILAVTLLAVYLVESPTEFHRGFDLCGGYILLYCFLKDFRGEGEKEDAYAVLLDLLLGHRSVLCLRMYT
jgi:hypothetical protein